MRAWLRSARQPLMLVTVVGALLLPVLVDSDDFPLSTYPMYSRERPAEVSFVTAQGVAPDGTIVPLGLDVIGASDDPLVVAGELRAAIRDDRAAEQCDLILSRLHDDAFAEGQQSGLIVRVVTERHDVVEHTRDRPSLLDRVVHAECGAVS